MNSHIIIAIKLFTSNDLIGYLPITRSAIDWSITIEYDVRLLWSHMIYCINVPYQYLFLPLSALVFLKPGRVLRCTLASFDCTFQLLSVLYDLGNGIYCYVSCNILSAISAWMVGSLLTNVSSNVLPSNPISNASCKSSCMICALAMVYNCSLLICIIVSLFRLLLIMVAYLYLTPCDG